MKKVLKIFAMAVVAMAVAGCSESDEAYSDEPIKRKYAESASASLTESMGLFPIEIEINGCLTELYDGNFQIDFSDYEKEPGSVDFSLISSEYVKNSLQLSIPNIYVEGKPYDAEFNHYSDCASLMRESKTEEVAVEISGKVWDEYFAKRAEQTRNTPIIIKFKYDITIEFTDSEGNDWKITIYQM